MGRKMENAFDVFIFQNCPNGIDMMDVLYNKMYILRYSALMTPGQVIQNNDVMSLTAQFFYRMTANITGTTSH
jgi:hypothetical protein